MGALYLHPGEWFIAFKDKHFIQIISRRTLSVSVCLVDELLSGSEALQQKDGEEQERDEKLFAEPVLLGYTELGIHYFTDEKSTIKTH
jgi:hypothetical protein